ncbi:UNVERIFIED_CONTAM: hypothetical protein Scaly_2442100 [Sesamum calycinum]|uniref:DUF4218 domain-containing protein n=1 Tax=Sesamum calycinum TaxID=2727403 RepID=A0AAW2LZX3_9LAMI
MKPSYFASSHDGIRDDDDVNLEHCKFCGDARYKPSRGRDPHWKKSSYVVLRYLPLTSHLQRLYSSRTTGEHMTYHASYQTEEGSTCHPSNAEAWKHFNRMYPDFAEEPHNVRLSLCTDGFVPHGGVDVDCERPLAYGMASRWTTARVMGCPICMDDTRAFHLQHELRMHDMKSHGYHVFIQKLILTGFREMLPEHVWSTLIEVSLLFQSICSTTLDVHKFNELENSVAIILCNLEKIFSPAFFDSIEHLIVHLPYEACIGGLVQHKWMYPLERFLSELKKKV